MLGVSPNTSHHCWGGRALGAPLVHTTAEKGRAWVKDFGSRTTSKLLCKKESGRGGGGCVCVEYKAIPPLLRREWLWLRTTGKLLCRVGGGGGGGGGEWNIRQSLAHTRQMPSLASQTLYQPKRGRKGSGREGSVVADMCGITSLCVSMYATAAIELHAFLSNSTMHREAPVTFDLVAIRGGQ